MIDRLKRMYADGYNMTLIGQSLGLSRQVVGRKLCDLGLKRPRLTKPQLSRTDAPTVSRDRVPGAATIELPRSKRLTSTTDLVAHACQLAHLSHAQMRDVTKTRYARVRWAVIACAKSQWPTFKYGQLGRLVGMADHTSVIYALRQAEKLLVIDPEFRAFCERLLGDDAPVALAWIDRPPRSEPACARLLEGIPEEGVGPIIHPTKEPGPKLSPQELFERRECAETARQQNERRWLAAERARWGSTRQTRTGPLSGQVA